MMYTIKPVFHGTFRDFEKSVFTFKKDQGVKITAAMVSYLIEGNGLTILVDTGPPAPEDAKTMTHRHVADATHLAEELARLGTTPEQVDTIILTHLHWDHSYNLEMFPKAPIYVQKREIQYAVVPLPSDTIPYCYDAQNGQPSWFAGFQRMRFVDGDAKLTQGIELLLMPGHTPGIQGVLVQTEEGRYLIASDIYPLYENYESCIPSGNHVDLREWFDSHERAKKVCDFILPGHDMKVMDRKVYGKK